jgi:hypothetical protein
VANHKNRAVAAAVAVGDTRVSVTLGNTAAAANDYAEGYLHCNATGAPGSVYKIKSHLAIDANGTGWINLYDPVTKAMTTSSKVTLTKNHYKDVVTCPTTLTSVPVGVSIVDVTNGYYFWLQTYGPCAVLTNGTIVVGNGVIPSGSVSGAVDAEAAASIVPRVGFVLQVNADTEFSLIFLRLSP